MITAVVSSYHYGHLASHCIESLLSQTALPDKVLFVDDGVGDCTHLPNIYPEVEYIFREKNLGVVDNFQDMLMRVKTEYVVFIGADNWMRSDAFEIFSNIKTDILTYDIMVTGELKKEILKRHPAEVHFSCGDLHWERKNVHHGSMVYKTKLGQEVGYKRLSPHFQHSCEDLFMWREMIKRGATISYCNQALLFYRRHRENFNKY